MTHFEEPDLHRHFHQYKEKLNMIDSHELHMDAMYLPESVGSGFIKRIIVRNGLELVYTDYRMFADHNTTFSGVEALIEVNYCLEGGGSYEITGNRTDLKEDALQLLLMTKVHASMRHEPHKRMRFLGIRMSEVLFDQYARDELQGVTNSFGRLLGGENYRLFESRITPKIHLLIGQMIERMEQTPLKLIFMESAVLELLGLSLQECLPGPTPTGKSILRGGDTEKIHQARQILQERMENPPSLLELSRLVGLNDYKLKMGFKELFGTTVFGTLREMRLERAKACLTEGRMNVSEAAYFVGYLNPGYFAEAFRKKYRVLPHSLIPRSAPTPPPTDRSVQPQQ